MRHCLKSFQDIHIFKVQNNSYVSHFSNHTHIELLKIPQGISDKVQYWLLRTLPVSQIWQ